MNFKILMLSVFFISGCSYFQTKTATDNLSGNSLEHNVEIDSLRTIIATKDNELDSLNTILEGLFLEINSLKEELEEANSRVSVNDKFVIPDSIEFAGQMFNLKNDRIYAKFEEIYKQELKNARRFIPRSGIYFPVFDSVFSSYDIPLDVKYLAVAESGLNSMATSWAGAAGMWQFMKKTAKGYKLKVNDFIDERRHVFKATEGAAEYLINAKNYLGNKGTDDWLLIFCSYNAGPGSIAKVMREQGGTRFFDLILRVDETNRYVWRAVAIKLIFENEEEIFGHKLPREKSLYETVRREKLVLNGHYKIDDWAKAQGSATGRIWEFNPWIKIYKRKLKKWSAINDVVLPPGKYEVLVPVESVKNENKLASIEKRYLKKNAGYFTHHIVKKGDTLSGIAAKYKTSVKRIKALNKLHNNIIRPGQKLRLYGKASTLKRKVYTVKSGDTIGKIASKLGITSSCLVKKNKLKVKNKGTGKLVIIYPGQKLYY
ncbi:MAG: hypothetical protein CSB55_02620 [Candidatus Cloacimonadota bacterium]|nr:MAG: hypothetical protein CSB55_02620 [Candidatus Cloacimonadota bacterium]